MSEWPLVKLNEIVDITSSKRVKRADYVDEGVPFFRSKEVIERSKGNDISTELFITEEHFEKIYTKFGAPEEGDILLTSVGTLGIPYQVQADDRFYFKDGNLTWFRNFKDTVNPKFLYYWLTSPIAKRKFDEVTIGSTQKALTIVALKSLELNLPPSEIQNQIVDVLDSLDGKLTNNRQTNQTLEQIAQAIFKSWFVDFEPVKAKIQAKQNGQAPELAAMCAISGKTVEQLKALDKTVLQQLKTTAALFPNALVESELGAIPEGWNVVPLSKHIDVKHGFAFKGEYFSNEATNNILLTPGNFKVGGGFKFEKLKYYNGPIPDEYILKKNDLLITMTDLSKQADTLGYPALVPEIGDFVFLHNQRLGKVVRRNRDLGKYFLYCLFRSHRYRTEIVGGVTGTTVKHTAPKKILAFEHPFQGALEKILDDVVCALYSKIEYNMNNNSVFTELRDILLPKLLSGEISLDNSNQDMEVAANG